MTPRPPLPVIAMGLAALAAPVVLGGVLFVLAWVML